MVLDKCPKYSLYGRVSQYFRDQLQTWIMNKWESIFENWADMKKDIANFVAKCLERQLFKAKHGHPVGLLQPHNILESKWEAISMDFIVELPETTKRHNSILVVVDKLTKSAHFIPVRDTYKASEIAQVFIKDVVILHGFPKKIISDRASIFTGRFWTSF